MIKLKYIGATALAFGVSVATLTAIIASAAPGDVVYERRAAHVRLTAGQRTSAATCLGQSFPALVPANVTAVELWRDPELGPQIQASDARTPTNEEIIAADLAGQPMPQGEKREPAHTLSGSESTCWAGVISSTHPAIAIAKMTRYLLQRVPGRVDINAFAQYVTSATPAAYIADRANSVRAMERE